MSIYDPHEEQATIYILRAQLAESRAEVSRLEGVILAAANARLDSHEATALQVEARRIRAQREEGKP